MNRRKPIVIGETYIYDVLNETEEAMSTTMVTVIKKSRHGFMVRSVNNGECFESKAEYLTPYVKSEEASVIRCQYGTTDIDDRDIKALDTISRTMALMKETIMTFDKDGIKTIEDIEIESIEQTTYCMLDLVKRLRDKLKVYADISKYKVAMETIVNTKKAAENTLFSFNSNNDNKDWNHQFKRRIDSCIESYVNNKTRRQPTPEEVVNTLLLSIQNEYINDDTITHDEYINTLKSVIESNMVIPSNKRAIVDRDIYGMAKSIYNNISNDTTNYSKNLTNYEMLFVYRSPITGNTLVSDPVEIYNDKEKTMTSISRALRKVFPGVNSDNITVAECGMVYFIIAKTKYCDMINEDYDEYVEGDDFDEEY